jgi:hypothetical protein
MQTLVFILVAAAVMLANALIAWVLAWFFTEVIILPIKKKPFNCRGCMSFWLTWLMGVAWAFVLVRYVAPVLNTEARVIVIAGLIGVAFLVGLINYLYIKTKFRIYE